MIHQVNADAAGLAPGGSVRHVFQRMARSLFKNALVKQVAPYGPNICHGYVCLKARSRNLEAYDRIWLYGERQAGVPYVIHSVLTDEHHRVLMDSFSGYGEFLGPRGYDQINPQNRDDKTHLDCLANLSIDQLYDQYAEH